jgi:hypothetical protein
MIIGVLGANGEGKSSFIVDFINAHDLKGKYYYLSLLDKPLNTDVNEWFNGIINKLIDKHSHTAKDINWLVVDDLDNFNVSSASIFNDLVIMARHYNLNIIYSTRRLAYFTKTLVLNTDYFVVFHILASDLKILNDMVGFEWQEIPPKGSHKYIIYEQS